MGFKDQICLKCEKLILKFSNQCLSSQWGMLPKITDKVGMQIPAWPFCVQPCQPCRPGRRHKGPAWPEKDRAQAAAHRATNLNSNPFLQHELLRPLLTKSHTKIKNLHFDKLMDEFCLDHYYQLLLEDHRRARREENTLQFDK